MLFGCIWFFKQSANEFSATTDVPTAPRPQTTVAHVAYAAGVASKVGKHPPKHTITEAPRPIPILLSKSLIQELKSAFDMCEFPPTGTVSPVPRSGLPVVWVWENKDELCPISNRATNVVVIICFNMFLF